MNHSNLAIDQFDKYYYYHLLILKINSPKYNNTYFLLAVDCGDPPVPENGDVIFDDTTFRNQATQSCNSGYELQGVVIRTCQANGKWSDDVAICTRKLDKYAVSINDFTKNTIIINLFLAVDCGTLDDPENGQVSFTSTTFLSIARYTCDVGFERVGTAVRGCQANGQWSSQAPVCRREACIANIFVNKDNYCCFTLAITH